MHKYAPLTRAKPYASGVGDPINRFFELKPARRKIKAKEG